MIKGKAHTVSFFVQDLANGGGKTGDGANLTLRIIADGIASAPTNGVSEIDATNAKGWYKVTITAGENSGAIMSLSVQSSTTDVACPGVSWTNTANVEAIDEQDATATAAVDFDDLAAILNDTDDLQSNQGSWLTATGFAVAGDAMTLTSAYDAAKTASQFDASTDDVTIAQAFPANFASLGINSSGHVSWVVLVDTTTVNTDMRGTDGANTTTPATAAEVTTAKDEILTRGSTGPWTTGSGGGGGVDADQIVTDVIAGLGGTPVKIVSPYNTKTESLTLVQRSDYLTSEVSGALRIPVAQAGMTAGDVAQFDAELEDDNGKVIQRIASTGTIVDVGDAQFAEFQIDQDDTDKTASECWRYSVAHINGDVVSPLKVDKPMTLAPNHAEADS